jgi:hypothetical protein
MKALLLLLLFGLCPPALASKEKISVAPGDTLEIAIGINSADVNTIKTVRTILSEVENVKVICFCSNSSIYILRAYTSLTREELFRNCEKAVGNTQLFLKEGDIKSIFSECYYSEEEDPAAIKEFLNR